MSSLGGALQGVSQRLLNEFGYDVTLRRTTQNGRTTGGTITTASVVLHVLKAVDINASMREILSGSVDMLDRRILVSTTIIPKTTDIIIVDNVEYDIRNIESIRVQNNVVVYIITMRA